MVKAGYKDTEVGVIPDDWELSKIKDVCIIINGRGFKPHEWSPNGLPIIRIQNLNGSDDFNYYSGQFDPKIFIKRNQLLFAWSGSRGTSFGPHIWNGVNALLNYHTWKLSVDDSKIDSKYFYHALKILTKHIEEQAHGASALVHTQKGEMEEFIFGRPQKEEQQAIAKALSDVDALITSLDKLIAKKRTIKTATMQQLLTGKTRLPGFEGGNSGYLGELFTKGNRRGYIKKDEIITFIGMENISEKGGVLNSKILPLNDIKKGLTFFKKEDVLVAKITPCFENGKGACLHKLQTNFGFGSTEFHVLRANYNADPKYIYYHTQMQEFRTNLGLQMIGTAGQKRVPIVAIQNYKLRILPLKVEQSAIALILSDMDAEITALENRLNKTKAIKQGMMQELLTGRTRLV